MYGWDSYFETLGLLVDGRVELARGMVENFWYELEHYGRILNANRSYYLSRSQPPFLTDMMIETYKELGQKPLWTYEKGDEWINTGIRAAVKELFGVWLSDPRLDQSTGLVKFHPEGVGIPPETEANHFDHILKPFADMKNVDIPTFFQMYQSGDWKEPVLDEYFLHDRAVRESGHDTTYRFDGRCAHLVTIDLNSLIYKYEQDLAFLIERHCAKKRVNFHVRHGQDNIHLNDFLKWLADFNSQGVNGMIGPRTIWNTSWARSILIFDTNTGSIQSNFDDDLIHYGQESDILTPSGYFWVSIPASLFTKLATRQKELVDHFLWCPEDNLYYDYNCSIHTRSIYKTCTAFWALWAGLVPQERAEGLVKAGLENFMVPGGLVSGTLESRGKISLSRPSRQWDFPFGWAPHQILAWKGLENYGFLKEMQSLVYRWLYCITKAFVNFNGVVPEKFDVVNVSHLVEVEYGNVGVDFKCVAKEGFGWMNASYQIGSQLLTRKQKLLLGNLQHPDKIVF